MVVVCITKQTEPKTFGSLSVTTFMEELRQDSGVHLFSIGSFPYKY